MKKTFILLVLVTLTIFCAHSQKTIPGYYFYDGARMEIPVSTTSALVYFNKAYISIDYMPANATIFVTDLYGNRVLTDQLNSSSYSLDLEGKPSGTYYIFVVANNRLIGMNNIVVY